MKQTKIILKDLAFFARHGLTEEEANLGQRFKVDVVAELTETSDLKNLKYDTTEGTVDYVLIYKEVKLIFENERYNLIEACAHAIASKLLKEFTSIYKVSVIVKKPSVPVDCICEYFAAEVTLCR